MIPGSSYPQRGWIILPHGGHIETHLIICDNKKRDIPNTPINESLVCQHTFSSRIPTLAATTTVQVDIYQRPKKLLEWSKKLNLTLSLLWRTVRLLAQRWKGDWSQSSLQMAPRDDHVWLAGNRGKGTSSPTDQLTSLSPITLTCTKFYFYRAALTKNMQKKTHYCIKAKNAV